ncbi:MAG: ribosome maturation factor RimP [Gammaproteobacteria bacterium]|nr:ribosome maturation factor RimP [Gammaproteobacteria bacterium]
MGFFVAQVFWPALLVVRENPGSDRRTVGMGHWPIFCLKTVSYLLNQTIKRMTGDDLTALLEPTIERLGYELADLEASLSGGSCVIRVFIDHPDGIGLDDCEKVSLAVSALLDVEDPVPGHYDLEVSSPGLNRKLTKNEHFQRYTGETVKVQMRFPIAGRKRFRGVLKASDDEHIVVEVDGQSHTLPMETIDTARLVPNAA